MKCIGSACNTSYNTTHYPFTIFKNIIVTENQHIG